MTELENEEMDQVKYLCELWDQLITAKIPHEKIALTLQRHHDYHPRIRTALLMVVNKERAMLRRGEVMNAAYAFEYFYRMADKLRWAKGGKYSDDTIIMQRKSTSNARSQNSTRDGMAAGTQTSCSPTPSANGNNPAIDPLWF